MKDFKKAIKEALTPHYLRESVNEDFPHSSLAITDQSQVSGLDDSELLDLLNKVSYEYTPELKDSARIISQEIEDRDLTNKIHYVDNERYEFRESVNEYGSNWEKKLSKKAVWVDSYVPKVGDELIMAYQGSTVRNKTGVVTSVSDDMAQVDFGGGDSYGIMFSRIKADKEGNKYINEDIVDDKAKIYWLQKLKSGEIDTLPDNPRMEYLRHAMRDQLAQDKEQLSRERGEMSGEEEHEHVKNLLKRNFMDEAEARVDEIDMNDPALMAARAAKMADEKEKAKQADLKQKEDFKKTYLNKKYGSSFMDKLEAEIGLKSELQDLKDEREMLMIDMEQEAEPEGGEIADRYGSRLNKIDARMELIQKDIDDLRMYESVNEESEGDKEIKALEKEAEKYSKTDSRYMQIQKKIGNLKSDKDYALPGSKADKKFSDMNEDRFKKNEDSYIRITEPRFSKDKNSPNFLFGRINYDTGPGVGMALGKETMAGQIRRLSSMEAMRRMKAIAVQLEDAFDLEDIDVYDKENGVVELFAVSDDFIDMDPRSELSTAMLNEEFKVGDKVTYLGHPAVVTATQEYNGRDFVSVSYDKGNGATKARMILATSGDVKPVKEGTCGYGEDGKIGKNPAGPVDEIFPMGSSSSRDIKNKAARERSSNKTANYHDLLKYYQFGIARIPRHKREKAGIPQAMHDRYGQEVWDILKQAYPTKGLSDTPPSDWRDSADELIMVFSDEGDFKKAIYNPFYDIYAKLGPTDSHKKQLGINEMEDEIPAFMMRDGMYRELVDDSVSYNDFEKRIYGFVGPKFYKSIHSEHPGALKNFYDKFRFTNSSLEEESDTDVGGGAKQAIGLDIDDEGASDAALDSEVNKMGYAESKEFNFKKMIKEALTPDYLK